MSLCYSKRANAGNEINAKFMEMSFSPTEWRKVKSLNVFINFNYHLKFLSLIFTLAKRGTRVNVVVCLPLCMVFSTESTQNN